MGGWRDVDGRTASERRKALREAGRAHFTDTARRRPLTLLKGLAGFALIALVCLALVNWLH